ncbi:MAG TPA: VOC family protein [Steroidobacteraceae bacterium]|jgi:catechol 2,3-dioxygenase-like lactoylglutathione lyase family enzyme
MRHKVITGTLILGLSTAMLACGAHPQPNPLGLRPHHITASVLDLERAVNWYRSMLGFEVKERGSHGTMQFAELAVPGFGVALVKEAGIDPRDPLARQAPPYWMHMVFSVADPDAVYGLLKSRGALVSTRQEPPPRPISSFLIKDSEGNEIEIVKH